MKARENDLSGRGQGSRLLHRWGLPPISLILCLGLAPSISTADAYLDAIQAEAETMKPAVAAANPVAPEQNTAAVKPLAVTQAMRDEFERAIKQKSSATARTYTKLDDSHRDAVVQHYFSQGKSMDNMVMKIFEQYSDQLRGQ